MNKIYNMPWVPVTMVSRWAWIKARLFGDVVIAFPGGRGTADMVNKASCRRIFIVRVPE